MKLSKSKFKKSINEAVHQFTLGKATPDLLEAIEILNAKISELNKKLDDRYAEARKRLTKS